MSQIRRILLAVIFLTALPAGAHHSSAMFDQTKQLPLQGTVKEFRFTNPHSWIYLTVKNEQGEDVVWELEGGSVSQMARNGWTYKSLKAGDKINVTVKPRVDGTPGGSFNSVQLSDGTVLGSSPRI